MVRKSSSFAGRSAPRPLSRVTQSGRPRNWVIVRQEGGASEADRRQRNPRPGATVRSTSASRSRWTITRSAPSSPGTTSNSAVRFGIAQFSRPLTALASVET